MNSGRAFDLLIVGGGINGAGIARDAAGRNLRVMLVEQAGLAHFTSSASTKLIHGGLRYLEYLQLRLVREALRERERLLSIAPHLVTRARFVLPHQRHLRPAWLLRLGLLAYDALAPGTSLERSRGVRFATSELGEPLQDSLLKGFTYADCTVDDSRLVVLNVRDACERGADIRVGHRLLRATRVGAHWRVEILELASGRSYTALARVLVNAAGPWVGDVLNERIGGRGQRVLRLVKGSHIVVRRMYQGDQAYVLQNPDRRIVFVIPYQHAFTLIGTTDVEWPGQPGPVSISAGETEYLCRTVNSYFKRAIAPADVVWSYAGIRSLCDDAGSKAAELTRDYSLELEAPPGEAPVLTIVGGKITTYRSLAEHAMRKLAPFLPGLSGPWTAHRPLPGGDFPDGGLPAYLAQMQRRWPFLPQPQLHRMVHAYGTRLARLLEGVASREEMGQDFGGGLTQIEVDYLMRHEWAASTEDLYWRHTKTGLHASAADAQRLAEYLRAAHPAEASADLPAESRG
ncbi:MAG: glycerol-3-phosphate dehydrogenase [Steroidobacterales bacterium]